MTEPVHATPLDDVRLVKRAIVRRLRCSLLLATLCLAPGWAGTQTLACSEVCGLYSELVTAPERTLIGSILTLEKVARPAVGPRNTRGRWMQREVYLGPGAFDTTFYLGGGRIQRIEMVSTATDTQCRERKAWADTVAALEAWQAKAAVRGEFGDGSQIQQSVHWAHGEVDVMAYLSVTDKACSTKVAFKKREVKDAAAL